MVGISCSGVAEISRWGDQNKNNPTNCTLKFISLITFKKYTIWSTKYENENIQNYGHLGGGHGIRKKIYK